MNKVRRLSTLELLAGREHLLAWDNGFPQEVRLHAEHDVLPHFQPGTTLAYPGPFRLSDAGLFRIERDSSDALIVRDVQRTFVVETLAYDQ